MHRFIPALKVLLFLLCLAPLARLGWGFQQDTLGANPIEALTRGLGTWGLNFLLITLAVTPLRKLSGWHWLTRLRRMLGLYAFFYVLLHLTSYLWLDQFFVWQDIAKDILKRPFITVGMAAFVLLVPLAATSNNYAIRRLGGKKWTQLHRTVYPIGIMAVLHYTWLVKLDVTKPLLYGLTLAALLGFRVLWRYREKQKQLGGAYLRKPKGRIIPIVAKR
ncbi:MAG: sulfoxide reductase heme-binding subunit YedZ [Rhodocyclaceae bacterium]|nr:MAG: sulfoxide reductase heme-binding subunit YedZ [Rhodocyclaceae bacterium]